MSQLLHEYVRRIEINLVGRLTAQDMPEENNGYSEFSAFVETAGDQITMVMDVSQPYMLTDNVYHEVSHMIDSKLECDALFREEALFSEARWAALNPEGFEYAYSYYELPDSVYDVAYDAYFLDAYARTYPTEDRARIMEYAMGGYDWMFGEGYGPLREKLAYYAACIRDAFDTTGWPEVTAWEAPLQTQ